MYNTGGLGEVNDSRASGELGADAEAIEAARQSRRNALKAGVAVGVGVTAWAAPQIGRLGGTPAYAAECTVKNSGVWLGCTNTDSSCSSGAVGYKPIGGGPGNSLPPPLSFGDGGTLQQNFNGNNLKGCPEDGASVTITVPTNQAGCRLTVIIHQNNCDSNWTWDASLDRIAQLPMCDENSAPADSCELARASTGFVKLEDSPGTVVVPSVDCGGSTGIPCSVFWSAVVECNTSPNCV